MVLQPRAVQPSGRHTPSVIPRPRTKGEGRLVQYYVSLLYVICESELEDNGNTHVNMLTLISINSNDSWFQRVQKMSSENEGIRIAKDIELVETVKILLVICEYLQYTGCL